LSDGQITPERGQGWLALYAVASFIYRGFLLATILWFLHRLLEPYGAAVFVQGIAVVVLSGFLLTPLIRMAKAATDPARSQRVSTPRLTASLLIAGGTLALIALVPLPFRITAPAVLEPAGASRVYVTVPGALCRAVAPGASVSAGQTLAVLENHEIELEVARLRGERDQQRRHLDGLERRRVQDASAAALIPAARQALDDSEERLRQRQIDQQRLELKSPLAGSVLPPHRLEPRAAAGDLPGWSGTPLDADNLGCWLDTGTMFCMIGDPGRLEATAIIDQSDVEFVTSGQRVGLQFDLTDGRILWGTVREIARLDLKVAPATLVEREDLAVKRDESGAPRPVAAMYEARIELDDPGRELLYGAPGRAKVYVAPRSLGSRLAQYLERTFRFRL
jgi:putative peptide zinc metalloprotease protein